MLHLELQWRGGRYLMVKGRDFVVLRKQPEGTWAFVEPAPSLLEALLSKP